MLLDERLRIKNYVLGMKAMLGGQEYSYLGKIEDSPVLDSMMVLAEPNSLDRLRAIPPAEIVSRQQFYYKLDARETQLVKREDGDTIIAGLSNRTAKDIDEEKIEVNGLIHLKMKFDKKGKKTDIDWDKPLSRYNNETLNNLRLKGLMVEHHPFNPDEDGMTSLFYAKLNASNYISDVGQGLDIRVLSGFIGSGFFATHLLDTGVLISTHNLELHQAEVLKKLELLHQEDFTTKNMVELYGTEGRNKLTAEPIVRIKATSCKYRVSIFGYTDCMPWGVMNRYPAFILVEGVHEDNKHKVKVTTSADITVTTSRGLSVGIF